MWYILLAPLLMPAPPLDGQLMEDPSNRQLGLTEISIFPRRERVAEFVLTNLMRQQTLGDRAALVRVSPRIGTLVSEHVRRILARNYAERLDGLDLYHGHFLVPRVTSCDRHPLRGLNLRQWERAVERYSLHFLYHTREHTQNWSTDPDTYLPVYTGPPRSIVGLRNGEIHPATSQTEHFADWGTVFGTEAFEFGGRAVKMCFGMENVTFPAAAPPVQFMHQFLIVPDDSGRYRLADGGRFDVYYQTDHRTAKPSRGK